jgi:quercetin dioxygenase-like cupin family protein
MAMHKTPDTVSMSTSAPILVLDADQSCPRLPLVASGGEAFAVVWPGVGATMRSMNRISLKAGGATVEMHHPSEAVYYVIAGEGAVSDRDAGSSEKIVEGSMFHVDPGTRYVCEAGVLGLELVGGPCPADPRLYQALAER